jgi:hypothetical protein
MYWARAGMIVVARGQLIAGGSLRRDVKRISELDAIPGLKNASAPLEIPQTQTITLSHIASVSRRKRTFRTEMRRQMPSQPKRSMMDKDKGLGLSELG